MAILRVPQEFPTIQAAVNAAMQGDVILVSDGDYNEEVLVNKNDLRIIAKGCNVVLDGEDIRTTAFTITNISEIEIKGFTIKNYAGVGINMINSNYNRILENKIYNIPTPINLITSFGTLIWKNELSGEFGILLSSAVSTWIIENEVRDCSDTGIGVVGSDGTAVIRNKVFNCDDGIIISSAIITIVEKNNIFQNTNGILNVASAGSSMLDNHILRNQDFGIALVSSANIIISENKIEGNDEAGIGAFTSSFNIIEKNCIDKNQDDGVFIDGSSSKNLIYKNRLEDNKPFDIELDNLDNDVVNNCCSTSSPANLCENCCGECHFKVGDPWTISL